MNSIKQGSGKYRAILHKQSTPKDLHSPSNWKSKLNDNTVTNTLVQQTRKNLMSRYQNSDASDILSRLKMGKTLFNNQLHHIGMEDSPFCKNCLRESNTETNEDMKHALHTCPSIQHLMSHVTQTFFPNINHTFSCKDTIMAVMDDIHPLYEGKAGHTIASLIWDSFKKYIMLCRGKNKIPLAVQVIKEIKNDVTRIRNLLPNTMVSKFILTSNELTEIFATNNTTQPTAPVLVLI
jgi:hypothetical protein